MKFNRMGKVFTFLLAAFVACGVVFGATGCGQSEEKLIEGAVNANLDQLKDLSDENIKSVLGESAYNELQSVGLDPAELYKAMFSKLEYTSKGVTVDGDTATATYDMTNLDMEAAFDNYMTSVSEWASSPEAIQVFTSEGEEGLTKHVVQLLMDALNDPELGTVTNEVSFQLNKNDKGEWEIADQDEMMQALFAGTDITSMLNG